MAKFTCCGGRNVVMLGDVDVLVLGGASFVGRSIVEDAIDRGMKVTTFNRGREGWTHPDAERIVGDRLNPADLMQLAARTWEIAFDTWSEAPRAVHDSTARLRDRVSRYIYVSSGSVYVPPPIMGGDENSPTVSASPTAESGDYGECKRGAELAVLGSFGDRGLLARAGSILGPHDNVGRLEWWLRRIDRGGRVLARGQPDQPFCKSSTHAISRGGFSTLPFATAVGFST